MLMPALVALALGTALLIWSAVRLRRYTGVGPFVQVIGAAGVLGIAAAHLCEALHWLPFMGWGQRHSIGHYFDLTSAMAVVVLVPLGFIAMRHQRPG